MGGSVSRLFVRLAARIDEVADRPAGLDPLSGGRRRGADRRRVRGVANAQDLPETDPGIDVASRAQDELARIKSGPASPDAWPGSDRWRVRRFLTGSIRRMRSAVGYAAPINTADVSGRRRCR